VLEDDFDFRSYYSADYFQGAVDDGYSDYVGSEASLRLEFRHTLEHLKTLVPRTSRLLEFGCAYGFFLSEASTVFDSVQGIELSADAVAFCVARGLDVITGVVDESTLVGVYDAVVGLDVIEHVPEPHTLVRAVSDHLRPGGVLLLTTGDWGSLVARCSGRKWRLMTPPQHLSFFTVAAMSRMLEGAGLRVVECSHPPKRVPASLIVYQLQRLLGLSPRPVPRLNEWALPINLWDAMRVIAVKPT